MSRITRRNVEVIKRATPQLNGKAERSHRSDGQEIYQQPSDKSDVDPEAKLGELECFYNFHRPHGAHNGKTPYEAPREKRKLPISAVQLELECVFRGHPAGDSDNIRPPIPI